MSCFFFTFAALGRGGRNGRAASEPLNFQSAIT